MSIPDNEWIYEQARLLSSDKRRDAVGALAWNLAVAFRRFAALSSGEPAPADAARSAQILNSTGGINERYQ